MIQDELNLLHHPIQLYAVESRRRDWRWLWLRRRAKRRLFFVGYASHLSWERSANEVDRISISLESAESRMKLRQSYLVEGPETGFDVPLGEEKA